MNADSYPNALSVETVLLNILDQNYPTIEPLTVELALMDEGERPGEMTFVGVSTSVACKLRALVRCALKNSGFDLPRGEVVVNVFPPSSYMDPDTAGPLGLPCAVGVLGLTGRYDHRLLENRIFVGEVGLDGSIKVPDGSCSPFFVEEEFGEFACNRSVVTGIHDKRDPCKDFNFFQELSARTQASFEHFGRISDLLDSLQSRVVMTGREAIATLEEDYGSFADVEGTFEEWAGDVLPCFKERPDALFEFDGEITAGSVRRIGLDGSDRANSPGVVARKATKAASRLASDCPHCNNLSGPWRL